MVKDFRVEYHADYYSDPVYSDIYMVDYERDRFLIINGDGFFQWVPISECKLSTI